MAIQLCPVDTANVHPRNILGSSSSFDRERLSPFGSLSAGKLWSTSPSAPGRPSLVANPARKGTLSSIARTPPAVASRRYTRTGGQRKTSGKLHVCARVPFDGSEIVFKPRRARPESATGSSLGSVVPRYCKEQNTLWLRAPLSKNSAKNTPEEGHARDKRGMTWALTR